MAKIPLSKGYEALVDDEDYEFLVQWKWCAIICSSRPYATRWLEGNKQIKMQNLLLPKKEGFIVDHINGDGLDNRRENLRYATPSQNCINRTCYVATSIYRGVYWSSRRGKWIAQVKVNGKAVNLGGFYYESLAALQYNAAAKRVHGEFAMLNEVEYVDEYLVDEEEAGEEREGEGKA